MKQFGFRIEEVEVAPGTLGLLYDETPELTTADIRPFIWAILLYRGAVKKHEAVGAVTPLCGHSELYSGFLMTWTQKTIERAWSGLWTRSWATGLPVACCVTAPRVICGSSTAGPPPS